MMNDRTRNVVIKRAWCGTNRRRRRLVGNLAYRRREGTTRDGAAGRMFDAGGEDADHGLRRLLGPHLGAGALVTFAPAPEQLVFVLLLVLSVVEEAILWFMPETATPKPVALASLRPRVHVPRIPRATFAAVTPLISPHGRWVGSTFLSCPRSSARQQQQPFPSSEARS